MESALGADAQLVIWRLACEQDRPAYEALCSYFAEKQCVGLARTDTCDLFVVPPVETVLQKFGISDCLDMVCIQVPTSCGDLAPPPCPHSASSARIASELELQSDSNMDRKRPHDETLLEPAQRHKRANVGPAMSPADVCSVECNG